MTCRHGPNDTDCSSHPSNRRDYVPPPVVLTPDADKYEILDVARVGQCLVLKVRYPNCSSCSYEGTKVLVYIDVSEAQALCWRRIDPHFSDKKKLKNEAPSPAARFPASTMGWADALAYAEQKHKAIRAIR